MSERRDLARNTAILAVGKVSMQALSFLLLPVYTFFLAPDDFGRVDLVLSYLMLLSPIVAMQIDRATFRHLIDARTDIQQQKRIASSVAAIILPTLLLMMLIFGLVSVWLQSGILALAVVTAATVLLSNQLLQFARGLGRNKLFSVASIITGILMFTVTSALIVAFDVGAIAILIGMIGAHLVAAIYTGYKLGIYRLIHRDAVDVSLQRQMLKYSLPLIPSGVSWWAISAADRTIISVLMGVAANGIYAIANRYAAILIALYSIFEMSWTESASIHINSERRHDFFSEVANSSLRAFGSIGLVLVSVIGLLFPLIVQGEFTEAYQYFPFMVIAVLIQSIVGTYSAIYIAKKMTKQVLNTSVVAAVISISLTAVLMPIMGLYAAIVSAITAFGFMAVFRHIDTRKYVKVVYEKSVFLKLILAYVAVYSLYFIEQLWASLLSVIVALLIAYLLNRSASHIIIGKVLSKAGLKSRLTKKQTIVKDVIDNQ